MNPHLPLLERVARMSQTARTVREQAHEMKIRASRYVQLRAQARAAGYNIPEERTVHRGRASPKLAAVLALMVGPGCERCGLRGPHRCVSLGQILALRQGGAVSFPVDELGNGPSTRFWRQITAGAA